MKGIVVPIPPLPEDHVDYIVGIQRWEHESLERARIEPLIRRRTKISFDPDLPPIHPTNQEAARSHGLHWNPSSGFFEDSDGCKVRDRFGQPL